jgi:hypothetical protein
LRFAGRFVFWRWRCVRWRLSRLRLQLLLDLITARDITRIIITHIITIITRAGTIGIAIMAAVPRAFRAGMLGSSACTRRASAKPMPR